MWSLNLPNNVGVMDDIDTALTYQSGIPKYAISPQQKSDVNDIYKNYDQNKGAAGVSLDSRHIQMDLLNALESAYNEIQINGRLSKLRDELLLNAKTCPCCGISVPDELDHHLPKSIYKVLAIYPRNLIAYCHKCNNKKRTVDGSDPNKRFIHAYYDSIPLNKQFLFANITLAGKSMTIDLEVRSIPELDKQLQKQMQYMMQKVDLKNRLLKELNNHLSSIATYIQSDYEKVGLIGVKQNLEKSAKHQADQFGFNHWRYAVIQALAAHNDFCDGGFYEPLGLTPVVSH